MMENCIVRYNPSCGWVSGWMVRGFFLPYFLQGCLQLQSMENSTARVGSMSHPMCTAVVSRLSSLFTEFELKWNLWIYQQKTRSIVLFVQTCYGRLHGPKGYGFGGGAGTLNTDSGNQIETEEKEKIQWGWMKISDFAIILQNYGWPSSSGTGTQSRHQRAPPARKGKVVPGAAATYIMQIRSRIEKIMRFPWLWIWKGSDLLSQNTNSQIDKRSATHLELWRLPGVLWQGSSLAQRVFQLQSLPQASWLQVPNFLPKT